MSDLYQRHAASLTAPARDGVAASIGPLANASRALWVGGGGDVTVTLVGGGAVTLRGVPGGTMLPLRAVSIDAGTTATLIVALW